MTTSCQPTSQKTMIEKSWSRLEVAKVLDRIAQSRLQWGALTDIAEEYAIPRTTVIHWKKRQDSIDHKPEVVDFFESAIGVAFLQQLMVAVTFVLTQIAGGGIQSVCLFLQLSGLDRFVEKMIATILFFFCRIHKYVRELNLSPDLESLIHKQLIPSYYIEYAASKAKEPKIRKELSEKASELRKPFNERDGPWCELSNIERELVDCVAKECAGGFQRSSSCVEGLNGQLSLWHHGRHSLSKRKLQALTTIHNYFTLRCNGRTAAQRFFSAKPRDMYEHLLKHMPLPVKPARSRAEGYRRFSYAA